jgi:hypothetical protein
MWWMTWQALFTAPCPFHDRRLAPAGLLEVIQKLHRGCHFLLSVLPLLLSRALES